MQTSMPLNKLIADLQIKPLNAVDLATIQITGVAYDSRQVKPGNLFVCIKGLKEDGQRFMQDAINAGAICIVGDETTTAPSNSNVAVISVGDTRAALSSIANRFYNDPTQQMRLLGITGTNGKTTLSFLLEAILKAANQDVGVIGTVNYRYGGKILPAKHTTPESADLYAMLATMQRVGINHAVMEVSSHALELQRVNGCRFDVGILTNITQDHLDFHGDINSYVRAKAKLFALMEENGKTATAVINGDDPLSAPILETVRRRGKIKLTTFGFSQTCDFRVSNVQFRHNGFTAEITTPEGGKQTLVSSLVGRHNLMNCLAALAGARALEIDWSAILKGIAQLHNVPGRLECISTDQGVTVYIDYAHTDDALANVLQALKLVRQEGQSGRGRIITIFGCGGDRDRRKRPRMGEVTASMSERVIVTSDNPRSEDPMAIIHEITAAGNLHNMIVGTEQFLVRREDKEPLATVLPDRREAIEVALRTALNGDLILIAGKGHEDYQEVKGIRHHFSDREVCCQLITEQLKWKIVSA